MFRLIAPSLPLRPALFSQYPENPSSRAFTPVILLLALLAGCGGSDGPSGPAQPVFTSLSLTVSSPTIFTRPPGNSATVTATALDQNGNPLSGLGSPTFTSGDTGIASIDPSGVVRAVASGTTSITASVTANGVTRTASVALTVAEGAMAAIVSAPGIAFQPQVVNLVAGGIVTWSFQDISHNVVFTTEGAPADLPFPWANTAHSRPFPDAGTFRYGCTVHAGMLGEVIVR